MRLCALALALLLAGCFGLSIWDGAGTAAFPFLLSSDWGAYGSSVGGAWVGWARSPDAFVYNPAATALAKRRGASASFGAFWGLFSAGMATYYQPVGERVKFALALPFVSYGEFRRTNELGELEGTFSAGDYMLVVSAALRASKSLCVGASVKGIYSAADTFSASAVCADVGVLAKFQRDRVRMGFVVANLGGMTSAYGDERYPLPLAAKLGVSYRLPGFPGTFGAQVESGLDRLFCARAGVELDFLKPLLLKVGYVLRRRSDEDPSGSEALRGLTAGAGVDYKHLTFAYSMQHFGALGVAHTFSVGYWGF